MAATKARHDETNIAPCFQCSAEPGDYHSDTCLVGVLSVTQAERDHAVKRADNEFQMRVAANQRRLRSEAERDQAVEYAYGLRDEAAGYRAALEGLLIHTGICDQRHYPNGEEGLECRYVREARRALNSREVSDAERAERNRQDYVHAIQSIAKASRSWSRSLSELAKTDEYARWAAPRIARYRAALEEIKVTRDLEIAHDTAERALL